MIGLLASNCQKSNYKPNVLVFAHAGGSLFPERAVFPANSFESIKYSVEVLEAEGVEIDVQVTKDSVLVLYHDEFITTAPGFEGCIGSYNWDVIKNMQLKNLPYNLVKLDTVLNYLVKNNITTYLDIKSYNFCANARNPVSVIADSIESIMSNYTFEERQLVIGGCRDRLLLTALKTDIKSYEAFSILKGIAVAEEEAFNYVLFPNYILNEDSVLIIKNSPFRWGVFGGKSNGQIRKLISFNPDCIISDNFVFTQKITK